MSIELYLLRHAAAETGGTDASRALTRDGHRAAKDAATTLARLGFTVDLVLCSPALRAHQTALIFQLALCRADLEDDAALAAGAVPEVVARLLETRREKAGALRRVLVVGHMPDLADLSLYLAAEAKAASASFAPAQMVRFDFDDAIGRGRGRLVWSLRAEAMAELVELPKG
ncbi:MAG: histidine phosphatase family protein [Deltaproteobacteria bacterium]|nr:histidine phosphatase family protein [Deltaproteobacteria bacterium]